MEIKNTISEQFAPLHSWSLAELISHLREEAQSATTHFLSLDPTTLTRQNVLPFGKELWTVYRSTALFPNLQVVERLEALGFRPAYHLWFIALQDVLVCLDAINGDSEVPINKTEALLTVRSHLEIKISIEIAQFLRLTAKVEDNPYATRLSADLRKLFRRRKHAIALNRPLILRGEYEQKLYRDVIEVGEAIVGDWVLSEWLLLQWTAGNTRKTQLRNIVEACNTEKKNNAFYRRFYPLFKLICPDEILLSEQEFKASEEHYTRSYAAYQAKRVRDLIRKGRKEL